MIFSFQFRAMNGSCAWLLVSACLVNLTWAGAASATMIGGPTLQIEVDARDLPRRLLHTLVHGPCKPGKLALWFPKWVPGVHGPSGPVQNVGGLRLETTAESPLPWHRDESEPFRIECEVPDGLDKIRVRLDTICNQPSVLASGYLSYGNTSLGIINWGTCLVYPEGYSCGDIQVHLSVRLPSDWRYATGLKSERNKDGRATFEMLSLTELIDCPLIAGEHLRSIALDSGKNPPAFLDLVSESPGTLQIGSNVVNTYSRLVNEAGAIFGTCHYPEFHFLITCSNELGDFGLEHLTSSLNGIGERDLIDDARRKGWVTNLLPHEYVHSWCGKFRRPAGMCTPDFQTPQKTRLPWVYEGLAQYLGEVLAVRSGLVSPSEYRDTLAASIRTLSHHEGRRWRPLEDTAVASHLLRAGSPNWNDLRRDQDYYHEGMLLWLESDAIIRERSHGTKSLDDFCRKFLGANTSTAKVVPFDLPEIVEILRGLAEFDWESFLARRVAQPQEALPLDVVRRCGYLVRFAVQPPRTQAIRRSSDLDGGVSARDSIGLALAGDGRITEVMPGTSSARAYLACGMKVVGVNKKTFSRQQLLDALVSSAKLHKIELLVLQGERFRTIKIDYSGGPRYFVLARDESKPDILAQILKPLQVTAEGTSALSGPFPN